VCVRARQSADRDGRRKRRTRTWWGKEERIPLTERRCVRTCGKSCAAARTLGFGRWCGRRQLTWGRRRGRAFHMLIVRCRIINGLNTAAQELMSLPNAAVFSPNRKDVQQALPPHLRRGSTRGGTRGPKRQSIKHQHTSSPFRIYVKWYHLLQLITTNNPIYVAHKPRTASRAIGQGGGKQRARDTDCDNVHSPAGSPTRATQTRSATDCPRWIDPPANVCHRINAMFELPHRLLECRGHVSPTQRPGDPGWTLRARVSLGLRGRHRHRHRRYRYESWFWWRRRRE
jgi:hypothetical protein